MSRYMMSAALSLLAEAQPTHRHGLGWKWAVLS